MGAGYSTYAGLVTMVGDADGRGVVVCVCMYCVCGGLGLVGFGVYVCTVCIVCPVRSGCWGLIGMRESVRLELWSCGIVELGMM